MFEDWNAQDGVMLIKLFVDAHHTRGVRVLVKYQRSEERHKRPRWYLVHRTDVIRRYDMTTKVIRKRLKIHDRSPTFSAISGRLSAAQ